MILTGKQIQAFHGNGLVIRPFLETQLNPNSYNLRLADELLVYAECPDIFSREPWVLDMKKKNPYRVFTIPKTGFVLQPGVLYLARTEEYTETHKFVPMLEGRSSVGRLGISIHATAGFGDIGFCGYWTLEISCVQPVRIYPGVDICQIYYHTIGPDSDIWIPDDETIIKYSSGKYQNNSGIQPSMMWKDFV